MVGDFGEHQPTPQTPGSGLGIDGFGADLIETVDPEGSGEVPVVEDLVDGRPGGRSLGAGDGRPLDGDGVARDGAFSTDDGSGDDPLHDHVVAVGSSRDGDSAAVLRADGIDTIDDIRPEEAVLGELGREAGGGGHHKGGQPDDSTHGNESKKGLPAIAKVGLGLVALIVLAVMSFAIFEPVQVLPRIRLAPGFSFVDQAGGRLTSDDGRGFVTLYSFVPSNCGESCDVIHDTLRDVGARVEADIDMGEAGFRIVTVALDTDDPEVLAEAAVASGADGEAWRWVGTAPERLREVVGGGFKVYYDDTDRSNVVFDQKYVIVDGTGLVRGEYSYATLASDADRLTRHVALLGEEIRNAEGNTALLYEAAHIFLCYP